jgi:protein-arginine kinase activator protein McsA
METPMFSFDSLDEIETMIETLIDELHVLVEDGDFEEAQLVNLEIRELEELLPST